MTASTGLAPDTATRAARRADAVRLGRISGLWHLVLDHAWEALADARSGGTARAAAELALGEVLVEAGRPEAAVRHLQRAQVVLRDRAGSERDHADALVLLAAGFRARGEHHRAVRALRRAAARLDGVDADAAGRVRDLLPEPDPAAAGAGAGAPDRVGADTARRSGRLPVPDMRDAHRSWSPDTARTLAEAQEALARLDETARRSALGKALAHAARLREIRATAHLDGLHLALAEVCVGVLPGVVVEAPHVPLLHRYVRADTLAHVDPDVDTGVLGRMAQAHAEDDADPWEPPDGLASRAGRRVVEEMLSWTADRHAGPPTVGKIALAHVHLVTAQPLRRGNPAVARAYLVMDLVRLGLLRRPWLSLSPWITRHHRDYLRHRHHVASGGDPEPFVAFLGSVITEACRHETGLVGRLDAARLRLGVPLRRCGSQIGPLLDDLATHPVVNVGFLTRRHAITGRGATDILDRLVEHGLVVPGGVARYGRTWRCPDALHLLTGPPWAQDPVDGAPAARPEAAPPATDPPVPSVRVAGAPAS